MNLRRGFRNATVAAGLVLGFFSFPAPAWSKPPVEIMGGTASEADVADDGKVTHHAAGFGFPGQLGDMPLRKVQVYGEADVSAYYTLRGGGHGDAWITFYVYPASVPMEDEVRGIEQALIQSMSASPTDAPAALPSSFRNGRSGWFHGTYQSMQLTTGYMVVQRGSWMLKARFSIPDAGGQSAIDRTVAALASVPWQWEPSEKTAPDEQVAAAR